MATQHASLETVEDFLSHKRIAMAGVSRNPASFSVKLSEELCHRGYDVVPVNPNVDEVQGRRCFERGQDIQPPVGGVLLMTSPKATESVVNDCLEAKVPRVWMHRATGKGSVSAEAVELCRGRGMAVVAGACCSYRTPRGSIAFTDSSARSLGITHGERLPIIALRR
jgi:hypothetical protein